MKKMIILAVILFMLTIVFWLVVFFTPAPDAPGYWLPSPVGSGWCTAHGIVGVKDGTRAHCPTPEK